ncbi:c-type cytochrome [Nevskia soli]|uniref:c-type cytochrome n=1 Tax=Nevskia soli TaxID=418856 RepID=UPI0004A76AD9|nr:cytochrome c [Nevskia soli]
MLITTPLATTMIRTSALLGLTAMAFSAQAQPGSADGLGWRLVRKYCSNCHEVRPHPKSQHYAADGAPSFAALAADPVKGRPEHLRSILSGPHSSMPPHEFSAEDVDALILYFQALQATGK